MSSGPAAVLAEIVAREELRAAAYAEQHRSPLAAHVLDATRGGPRGRGNRGSKSDDPLRGCGRDLWGLALPCLPRDPNLCGRLRSRGLHGTLLCLPCSNVVPDSGPPTIESRPDGSRCPDDQRTPSDLCPSKPVGARSNLPRPTSDLCPSFAERSSAPVVLGTD